MNLIVHQAVDTYSNLTVATDLAKHNLLHGVGMVAIELMALAVDRLPLSDLILCLWICTGQRNL